jgi:hypothetical protein
MATLNEIKFESTRGLKRGAPWGRDNFSFFLFLAAPLFFFGSYGGNSWHTDQGDAL